MINLVYARSADGGFVAGDTISGRTAYAYATSIYAAKARKTPLSVARVMVEQAISFGGCPDFVRADADSRNWRTLNEHGAV